MEHQPEMTFVQIDIETLGLHINAPILTVGAVAYNRRHGILSEFERTFDLDEQINAGRTISADTLCWWFTKVTQAARDAVFAQPPMSIAQVESQFYNWYKGLQDHQYVDDGDHIYASANGNDFDLARLESLFKVVPWNFKRKMCYRTLAILFKDEVTYETPGAAHSALADARAQAYVHLRLLDKHPQLLSSVKHKPATDQQ